MARIVLDDETTLDQDAEIYSKRTEESEKELKKNLTKEQKIQYFKDYHLPKILVGILVAALLVWMGKDFFAPRKETALYVAVVDDVIGLEEQEALKKDLEELLDIDTEKQEIILNADFSSQNLDSMSQLTTYMFAEEVDILITTPQEFETLARTGHFMVYDEAAETSFYSEYEEEKRLYVEIEDTDNVIESEEKRQEEGKSGQTISFAPGEGKTNCGLSLSDSGRMKEAGSRLEESCVGVVLTSTHKKNAAKCIRYLMG